MADQVKLIAPTGSQIVGLLTVSFLGWCSWWG